MRMHPPRLHRPATAASLSVQEVHRSGCSAHAFGLALHCKTWRRRTRQWCADVQGLLKVAAARARIGGLSEMHGRNLAKGEGSYVSYVPLIGACSVFSVCEVHSYTYTLTCSSLGVVRIAEQLKETLTQLQGRASPFMPGRLWLSRNAVGSDSKDVHQLHALTDHCGAFVQACGL